MEEKTPLPFAAVYSSAWKSAKSLWPLLAIEFLIALLRYAVLFTCAAVMFGPLLAKYGKQLADSADSARNFDWTPVMNDMASLFSNPSWVAVAAGLALLYVTWWCLLSALMDGGMFGSFWGQEKPEEPFALHRFFQDAMRFFVPMIWLQAWLGLYLLVPLLGLSVLVAGVTALLALTGFHVVAVWACVLLLGLPLAFLAVVFLFLFSIYTLAAKASLTRGLPVRQALREAYQACRAGRWRLTKGIGLMLLFYIALSFILRLVLGMLGLVPVIGPLFSFAGSLAGMALALLLGIYLPALAVGFYREGDLKP